MLPALVASTGSSPTNVTTPPRIHSKNLFVVLKPGSVRVNTGTSTQGRPHISLPICAWPPLVVRRHPVRDRRGDFDRSNPPFWLPRHCYFSVIQAARENVLGKYGDTALNRFVAPRGALRQNRLS
jgi:hypothetical protein